jgi:hypothetical protein
VLVVSASVLVLPVGSVVSQSAADVSFAAPSGGTSASLNGQGQFLAVVAFAPGAPIVPLRLPGACNTVGATTYRLVNFVTGDPLGGGFSFDAATRTISGTPTVEENSVFRLVATDSGGTADGRTNTAEFVFRFRVHSSYTTSTNTSVDCSYTPATPTTPTTTATTTTTVSAAPQAGGTLAALTVAVGGSSDADVASAFTGTVYSYSAASSDTSVATVSTSGSVVTVTGVVAGNATVTVTATNAAGSVSQSFAVTVSRLALTASAPAFCLTGEGRPVLIGAGSGVAGASSTAAATSSTVGREGVATVDVAYTISGGRGPYVVTSRDTTTSSGGAGAPGSPSTAPGAAVATRASAPKGALPASCALAGVNLDNVAPTANVVEAGPKTITLTVTDADGATATTTVTIQVAEDAYTTEYNGGTMRAGRSYVLGNPDEWTLITLPTGLDLRFEGISHIGDSGGAHFSDTISGSEIVLDWGNGAEIFRDILESVAGSGGTEARDVGGLFDSLRASATVPTGVSYPASAFKNPWQPYSGLPPFSEAAAVHPYMLEGKPIPVCNRATRGDFGSDTAYNKFTEAFNSAIAAWNAALHMETSATTGTPHMVFKKSSRCAVDAFLVSVHRDAENYPCHSEDALACATTYAGGANPPTIGGGETRDFTISVVLADEYHASFETILIHELGHFLGLADYGIFLRKCDGADDKSIMTNLQAIREDLNNDGRFDESEPIVSYGQLDCGSARLTARDLADIHAIYHPDVLRDYPDPAKGPRLVNADGWRILGKVPLDSERDIASVKRAEEFNAHRLVVWRRPLGSPVGSAYSYVKSFAMNSPVLMTGNVDIGLGAGFDATGWEFLVAGVTRGDWKRRTTDGAGSLVKWVAHSEVTSAELGNAAWSLDGDGGSRSWTLGDIVELSGPPATEPSSPSAVTGTGQVTVSWGVVPGATRYVMYYTKSSSEQPSGRTPVVRVDVNENTPQGPADRVSAMVDSLQNGRKYYFFVRAYVDRFPSGLSAPTSATPLARPDVTVGAPAVTSAALSWPQVVGAEGYKIRYHRLGQPHTAEVIIVPASTAEEVSVTLEGLAANTSYTISVWATNAGGVSSLSAHHITTAAPVVAPATPVTPVIRGSRTATTHNSVTIHWTTTDATTGLSFKVRYRQKGATTWGDDADAGGSSSHTFSGLVAQRTYEMQVQARRGAARSSWSTLATATTTAAPVVPPPPPPPPTLTGRARIQKMTPTTVGNWTLSLTFVLKGHGAIEPRLRFTKFEHLATTWQYTSTVSATIDGEVRSLGRVAYRKTTGTGDRIEIGFKPTGGSLILPRVRGINYGNMVLWRTYQTSEFSFTLPARGISGAAGDSEDAYAGRLAGGLAPGEVICTTCDAGIGDLEPMGDTDPPIDGTST